jgi:hypothetical protein
MYNVIFTIDYEIHGNGDGSPHELMIEPTYRMMSLFDKYGAKLTIMADVAEILKFREYKERFGEDKYYYDEVIKQLQYAVKNGHDVQLHIHSGYFKSDFTENGIKQEWDEYNLANLPYETIYKRIKTCKNFLEENLKLVKPDYKCLAFRAANWSMMPTKNIANALIDNNILIDSSVFKWGKRNNRVKFDYSDAYDKLLPWYIDENNICKKDNKGKLLEVPIYTENRSFWPFITYIRAFRMIRARFHKHHKHEENDAMDSNASVQNNSIKNDNRNNHKKTSKLHKLLKPFIKKHAWKLDLNQASGRQLINAVKRIENEYSNYNMDLPIVLIGHSKSFIKYNEKSLTPFMKYTANKSESFQFGIFKDIDLSKFRL